MVIYNCTTTESMLRAQQKSALANEADADTVLVIDQVALHTYA